MSGYDLFDASGKRVKRGSPHAKARDARRLVAIFELVRDGASRADATWQVLSDPLIGITRYIERAERGERVTDRVLEAKYWSLMGRNVPNLAKAAMLEAEARLIAALPDAVSRLAKNATRVGKKRAASAAAETKAAEVLLRAIGFMETGKGAVQAVQVNVSVNEEHAKAIAEADRVAAEILHNSEEPSE